MPTLPPVTEAQAAEHGLTPEEFERICAAIGRVPNLVELGVFSVMWSEHCSYKSSRARAARAADERPARAAGPGRERRRGRDRRRPGRRVQDREPQPSVVRRALPGRGDRRRRHPARRLHHGRAPDRQPELAALRQLRPPAHALPGRRRGRAASAATATASACRPSAARSTSTPATTRTFWSTPSPLGLVRADRIFRAQRHRRRQPGHLRRLEDRPRRHPRRQPARVGGVRRAPRSRSGRPCRSAIRSPRSC